MVFERKGLRWYYIASALFLVETSQGLGIIDRFVYGEWEFKPGDKITESLNVLMIATSLLLFWRAKKNGAGWIIALAAAGLLVLSTTWSVDPETTFRRGFLYLLLVMGTIGIVGNLESDEVMKLVAITCGLCAIASIILPVLFPSGGAFANSALRGIFPHKNGLGQVMAAGTLAQIHVMQIRGQQKRLFNILALILFIIVAFYAQSSTALLMIFAFCTVGGVIALFRKGGAARVLGVFSIVMAPAAGIFLLSFNILDLIGKDATLTGRTELWYYVMLEIQQRPILGWGYSAFWSVYNPAAAEISRAVGWTVPHAHNGLLAMLLDVGIVGTALFLFLWTRNVVLALQCMNTSAKGVAISSLLSCGAIVMGGTTEPVLSETGILLNVFLMTGLMCERAVRASYTQRYDTIPRAVPRLSPANAQDRTR
jgi:exopolysaccharide production protein ExoQ